MSQIYSLVVRRNKDAVMLWLMPSLECNCLLQCAKINKTFVSSYGWECCIPLDFLSVITVANIASNHVHNDEWCTINIWALYSQVTHIHASLSLIIPITIKLFIIYLRMLHCDVL